MGAASVTETDVCNDDIDSISVCDFARGKLVYVVCLKCFASLNV